MPTLVVSDSIPGTSCLVHLRDVLAALGPPVLEATWVMPKDGEPIEAWGRRWLDLKALAESAEHFSGHRFAEIAREIDQVIWGDFHGFASANRHEPWIVLRVFDGKHVIVRTEDDEVISRIQSAFHEVTVDETFD